MDKKQLVEIPIKIGISVVIFIIAAGLGGSFGKLVTGSNYSSMSMAGVFEISMIIPIWYNAPIYWRITAACAGTMAGVGTWLLSFLDLSSNIATQSQLIGFFRAGAIVVSLVVCLLVLRAFKVPRRIVASFSRKWRGKSEAFRAWAFGSLSWAVGTFLFVWLFDPDYTDGWAYDLPEFLNLLGVMIVPPLFLGAVWFGYKRFVK